MTKAVKHPFEASGDLAMRPESVGLTWPRAPREDQLRGSVAVVRVCGPLEHHGGGWWFDSYESILGRIEGAFQSDAVSAIVLDIDSPGGEVSGLQEAVRRIRSMRAQYDKPLIAFADDEAYSAAYALACSADEIYLPEGGGVGSIGVLATLCDRTAMTAKAGLRIEVIRSGDRKAEGHPDIPLSDGTISRVQSRVNELARQFFTLVKEARGVSKKSLADLQGACLYGQAAVDAGLADGIASFDEVVSSLMESSFDNAEDRSVSFKPNDRSAETDNGDSTMAFAALEKKVTDALAALQAAKTPAQKKTTAAAYAAAVAALTEAKVKKSYKKKTVEEEEETDDGEAEAEDAAEDEESASDDDGDDDEDGDDDDDGDGDEDEKAKKGKKAKKATASASGDLESFVRELTGKKSTAAARGVLQAMADMHERASETEATVRKLKAEGIRTRRNDLIEAGMREGKLSPGQRAWARTQSIASLKAYLEHTAPRFAPRQAAVGGPDLDVNGPANADATVGETGLTATEIEICRISGVSLDDYKARKAGAKKGA